MNALSQRQHRLLIGLLCIIAALLVSLALSRIPRELGMSAAHADTLALLDAGPGSGSGSAAASSPTVHDPSQDPAGYFSDLKTAKKNGWGLVVLVSVLGLCELLAAAGKKISALAWLGKGRVSIAIGAGAAIATTAIASLADGGSWSAVATAAIGAALLYWHPAAKDVAAQQQAQA